MTLGKGLGAGFPVAGLASTVAITSATPWGNPSGSSSSYGANPLASAAVLAASTVIENENLVQNSAEVGDFMLGRFKALQEKYDFIGDVRGKGLLIGIELVKDRVSKEPLDKKVCVRMFHECMKRGLISMIYNPHFRVNPALSMDRAAADTSIGILDEVFGLIAREGAWR